MIIPNETSVAAKTPNKKDKDGGEWILAKILSWHPEKQKYEIQDTEPDDSGVQTRYVLPPKSIIPIASQQEVASQPEIKTGEDVLALYPGTTCFYKATVMVQPSKNKDRERGSARPYIVRFEVDNYVLKDVDPIYVLDMPKIK